MEPRGSAIKIYPFLFPSICAIVTGDDGLHNFLEKVMDNFELGAPTVIIGEAVPEFCLTRKWVLCLQDSQNNAHHIAKHLETLHLTGGQFNRNIENLGEYFC